MPVLLFIWYVRLSKDKQIVLLVVFLGKKTNVKNILTLFSGFKSVPVAFWYEIYLAMLGKYP